MIVHLWSTQFWHKGSCYAASMVQKLSLLKHYFPLLVVLALHNCLACAIRFASPLCLNWSEPEPRISRDWEGIWYSMLELGLSWALGEVKYVQPPRRNLAAAWLVLPRCAGRIQCPVPSASMDRIMFIPKRVHSALCSFRCFVMILGWSEKEMVRNVMLDRHRRNLHPQANKANILGKHPLSFSRAWLTKPISAKFYLARFFFSTVE